VKNDSFKLESSKIEDILDWTLLWAGIVLLALGIIGALILFSGYKVLRDKVLQFAFTFVSFYMLFFGVLLILFHKKIVVRPVIKRY